MKGLKVAHKHLRRGAQRLAEDSRGGVAVTLALALPVLLGFAMLVIDGGRYYNLHTSVQGVADAAALAAAAELDRKPDAIDRAERALERLVQNDQRLGEGAARITREQLSVRYLMSLPARDGDPITSAYETTAPNLAHFVEVSVRPVPFQPLFARAFAAARNTDPTVMAGPTQAAASAVAGFDSVACGVTPLFMCNPFEGTAVNLFVGGNEPSFRRRLIALKQKGASYSSGNYGYLESAAGPGASEQKQAMAAAHPAGCYTMDGVSTQPGNIASTAEALNVRFDMYDGGFKNEIANPEYRPARNVRRRKTTATCNTTLPAYDKTQPEGFPRDHCHEDGTCATAYPQGEGRVGDGNWDFNGYWSYNYLNTPKPDLGSPIPSRYDVYKYELEEELMLKPSSTTLRSGAPVCYKGDPNDLSDTPDRRVFVGAILNCKALASDLNGRATGLPVAAYARFFLTEPMDKNDGTIWAELVEVLEPGTPSGRQVIRDTVQLYR